MAAVYLGKFLDPQEGISTGPGAADTCSRGGMIRLIGRKKVGEVDLTSDSSCAKISKSVQAH